MFSYEWGKSKGNSMQKDRAGRSSRGSSDAACVNNYSKQEAADGRHRRAAGVDTRCASQALVFTVWILLAFSRFSLGIEIKNQNVMNRDQTYNPMVSHTIKLIKSFIDAYSWQRGRKFLSMASFHEEKWQQPVKWSFLYQLCAEIFLSMQHELNFQEFHIYDPLQISATASRLSSRPQYSVLAIFFLN